MFKVQTNERDFAGTVNHLNKVKHTRLTRFIYVLKLFNDSANTV